MFNLANVWTEEHNHATKSGEKISAYAGDSGGLVYSVSNMY
jgi:hypothetical protein